MAPVFFLALLCLSVSGYPTYWFERDRNQLSCVPDPGEDVMGVPVIFEPFDARSPLIFLSSSEYNPNQQIQVTVRAGSYALGARLLVSASSGTLNPNLTALNDPPINLVDVLFRPQQGQLEGCTGIDSLDHSLIAVNQTTRVIYFTWIAPSEPVGNVILTATWSDGASVFQNRLTLLQARDYFPFQNSTGPGATINFLGEELHFSKYHPFDLGDDEDSTSQLMLYWQLNETANVIVIAVRGPSVDVGPGYWVGFGFPGRKAHTLNSRAVVAFARQSGPDQVLPYDLEGMTSDEVDPDWTSELHYVDMADFNVTTGEVTFLLFRSLTKEFAWGIPSITNSLTNVIFAVGPYPNDAPRLPKHYWHGTAQINFFTGEVIIPSDITPSKRAHAVLMALGWGFFIPLGIFVAHFKPFGDNWLIVHVFLQTFGTILGTIAFIVAVSVFGGHREHVDHEYMGWCVTVVSWLQLIGGYLRPAKGAPNRWVWLWFHRIFGPSIFAVAYVNIYFGIYYIGTQEKYTILVSVWIAVLGFIFIIVESIYIAKGHHTWEPLADKSSHPTGGDTELATRQSVAYDGAQSEATVFHTTK